MFRNKFLRKNWNLPQNFRDFHFFARSFIDSKLAVDFCVIPVKPTALWFDRCDFKVVYGVKKRNFQKQCNFLPFLMIFK